MASVGLVLAACGSAPPLLSEEKEAPVDYGIIDRLPDEPIDYTAKVRPILERRCVVCHGCYDAPCQLKLGSPEGIFRGGHKEQVYDGARIKATPPTRLFIDELSTRGWRTRGFYPVVNEGDNQPYRNLDQSVMYRMLRLKQRHPQPLVGMLRDIDTSLGRDQYCPTLDEFDDYAKKRPNQGMPFAMPNLETSEYETLVTWLAQGSPTPPAPRPSAVASPQIRAWEDFLNQPDRKHRLASRYIYEHLFLAHLHFEGDDHREFYSLIRSKTPPGAPPVPIATRRPYDSPGEKFYYRLRRVRGSVVAKDHMLYAMSPKRLARMQELFIAPDYEVAELPGHGPKVASNPFRAFDAIPVRSRYQFLLDDARFFVEGFMKGPVCRGQVALNVIEDRFWVVFFDPDAPISSNTDYVDQLAGLLALPTELEDTLRLVTTYGHYMDLENQYLDARRKAFQIDEPHPLDQAMSVLWDGEGKNRNAALTVFRHLDSASVENGLVGEVPQTAWVLDYPILERIHYLLVAGFDVYGNVGHQLNTRMFMDALRMEAENYFLALLPASIRRSTHDSWYTGIRSDNVRDEKVWWMNIELVTGYKTSRPIHELWSHIKTHLGPVGQPSRSRPCRSACDAPERKAAIARADRAIDRLGHVRGKALAYIPDVSFVRVELGKDPADDLAYSLINDKSYKNVSWMLSKEDIHDRRDYRDDRQTVVPWLEGAYPSFFFAVKLEELDRFIELFRKIESRPDYERLVGDFGIRRTNSEFWKHADWFSEQALRERPRRGGILDLNRYQNR